MFFYIELRVLIKAPVPPASRDGTHKKESFSPATPVGVPDSFRFCGGEGVFSDCPIAHYAAILTFLISHFKAMLAANRHYQGEMHRGHISPLIYCPD